MFNLAPANKYPNKGLTKSRKCANMIRTAMQPTKIVVTTEDLVTFRDAAGELGIHLATLYRWIEKGKVRPFRIGNQAFITTVDLEALKQERAKESPSA